MPAANEINRLKATGALLEESGKGVSRHKSSPCCQELELAAEYEVVKVVRDSKRGNPLIAAVVENLAFSREESVLIIDRADLPKIEKGRRLLLTAFAFGDCKVYRETLPR